MTSSIRYDVEQGQPLCSSNSVHFLPVMLISEEGNMVQWEFCLFIVADCGAEAIIGYPTLEKGKIIHYNPPVGYEQHLQQATKAQTSQSKEVLQAKAVQAAKCLHLHEHEAPPQIVQCMHSKTKQMLYGAEDTPKLEKQRVQQQQGK